MYSLDKLSLGEHAVIEDVNLSSAMRRRLYDIGLIPNTEVLCVGKSPLGDPVSFLICGSVIALRTSDLKGISIKEAP